MPTSRFLSPLPIALAIVLNGIALQATAADMQLEDLRLTLGSGPTPSHIKEDYTQASASGRPDGTYDYSLGGAASGELAVGYVGGHLARSGGLVWGGGLQAIGATYHAPLSPSNERIAISTFGPYGQLGYGYAITHRIDAELTGFVSAGGATGEWIDSHNDGKKTGRSGGYVELGARLAVTITLVRHLVLGVQGQLSSLSGRFKIDNNDGSRSDIRITLRGGALGALVGYRF